MRKYFLEPIVILHSFSNGSMLIYEIRTNQLELWRKVKLSGLISSQIALTKPSMGQNWTKQWFSEPRVVLHNFSSGTMLIRVIRVWPNIKLSGPN